MTGAPPAGLPYFSTSFQEKGHPSAQHANSKLKIRRQ
ncbi:hypothetical protein SLEP1_g54496 [Rubroshorea leprosula]|uniref:Uncharacterized protein n=1 Tax=Rubroshorea leprosula TaxID=152421 RepID=A0AAV5MCR4_9ROSI|nr:hypothetical protein SLEP1_g54496 [Rubroshorea leprosula]